MYHKTPLFLRLNLGLDYGVLGGDAMKKAYTRSFSSALFLPPLHLLSIPISMRRTRGWMNGYCVTDGAYH